MDFELKTQSDLEAYDEAVKVARKCLGLSEPPSGLYYLQVSQGLKWGTPIAEHIDADQRTLAPPKVCRTEIRAEFLMARAFAQAFPRWRNYPCNCGRVLWTHDGHHSLIEIFEKRKNLAVREIWYF